MMKMMNLMNALRVSTTSRSKFARTFWPKSHLPTVETPLRAALRLTALNF